MGVRKMVARGLSINGSPKIKYIIIHHSTGNDSYNYDAERIKKGLSKVGFEGGFKPYGFNRVTGYSVLHGQSPLIDPQTYRPTFCNYHYALHRFDADRNKYGYRLIRLIENPLKYDVGSTRSKKHNKYGIAVCIIGNYVERKISTDALRLLALKLKWLYYYNPNIKIIGHKDVAKTACPGKIYDQLDDLKKFLKE